MIQPLFQLLLKRLLIYFPIHQLLCYMIIILPHKKKFLHISFQRSGSVSFFLLYLFQTVPHTRGLSLIRAGSASRGIRNGRRIITPPVRFLYHHLFQRGLSVNRVIGFLPPFLHLREFPRYLLPARPRRSPQIQNLQGRYRPLHSASAS